VSPGRRGVSATENTVPDFQPLVGGMREERESIVSSQGKIEKARSKIGRADVTEINLAFRPPYDWQTIIRFYMSHTIPGVERVTEDSFERVFRLGNTIGFFRVRAVVDKPQLNLRTTTADPNNLAEVISRIRRMFDLDADPLFIARRFAQTPVLAKLCERFPGLRLPGGWDPFETAICSILGQLVSAAQRSTLVDQIVRSYGDEITHPVSGETTRLFPRPEVLVSSDLSDVRTTAGRREAIRDFSRRVLSGVISFSQAQDPVAFRQALLETKGLGPWSAEYISLRAIGDTDAFPKTDLVLKRALKLHPDLDLKPIKPWRSYAAIYLWKEFAQTLSKKKKEKRT
jgi:AraC family transcriptional regulator, regulatory protein of adaptative response / DNA-3-methyladenine glycosylase II